MPNRLHVPSMRRLTRRFVNRLLPLLALAALLAFAGAGIASAATPAQLPIWSNVDWHPLLGKDWAAVGDGRGDFTGVNDADSANPRGLAHLDLISDGADGPALYWSYYGGNVFFRLVLADDPLKTNGNELHSQVWSVRLQTSGSASAYALSVNGAQDVIYTKCGSGVDSLAETGHTASTGTAEGYADGGYTYWLDGRVRVSHMASTYYLDMAAPLSWFTPGDLGCGAASLTADAPVAIGALTSADAPNSNKDVLGAGDLGTYFTSVARAITLQIAASALNQSTLRVNSAQALHGDTLTYTIVVKNTGAQTFTPVLSDPLPAGVTYVPESATLAGATLADISGVSPIFSGYILPALAPGSSVDVTFQATVNSQDGDAIVLEDGDQIVDTATISAGGVTFTTSEAGGTTQVIAPVVNLQINPTTASFSPGEVIAYTITASNTGHADAKTLRVEIPIPNDTMYVDGSAHSAVGTIAEQHATDDPLSPVTSLEWLLPKLEQQKSGSLSFRAQVK